MKKTLTIFATTASLLGMASVATAQRWHARETTDPITDDLNVSASTTNWLAGVAMHVRCQRGVTDVFFVLTSTTDEKKISEDTTVEWKIDDRPVWRGEFNPEMRDEKKAIFAPSGVLIALARWMMDGSRLAFGYKPDGEIRQVAVFSLTGSRRAIGRVLTDCSRQRLADKARERMAEYRKNIRGRLMAAGFNMSPPMVTWVLNYVLRNDAWPPAGAISSAQRYIINSQPSTGARFAQIN